jgi:hypothetical protein
MVTNVLHLFAAPDELARRSDSTVQVQIGDRVLHQAREILCGLRGHHHMMQFQQGRVFMRCLLCGNESSGWELNETPPTVTAPRLPRPDLRAVS